MNPQNAAADPVRPDAARNTGQTTIPPEPRQTRRDVSWTVMFRLALTSVWVEWSNGHRSPQEAIDSAAPLRSMDAVASIRLDRVTRQCDMFSVEDFTAEGVLA